MPLTFRSLARWCWHGATRKSMRTPRGWTGILSRFCALSSLDPQPSLLWITHYREAPPTGETHHMAHPYTPPPMETATDPIHSAADMGQRWRALMGQLGFRERLVVIGFVGPDRGM